MKAKFICGIVDVTEAFVMITEAYVMITEAAEAGLEVPCLTKGVQYLGPVGIEPGT